MQSIIITLYLENESFDFEVPNGLTVEQLLERLAEIFRELHNYEIDEEEINLYFNGKKLNRRNTLRELGIWDGFELHLR